VKFGIVSTPGRRIYWSLLILRKQISIHSETDIFFLSTKKGLLTNDECLIYKIGGEVLFRLKVLW
jgi:ribosomal protein S8